MLERHISSKSLRPDFSLKPSRCSIRNLFPLTYLVPLAAILFLFQPTAYAAQATLAWDPNPEPDLAGYKVYYGTSSRIYDAVVDVGNWTHCTLDGLEEGKTYYLAATAYDTHGNESDFSEEVSHAIPKGDTDGDGIPDEDETGIYGTNPDKADTDEDGINDGDELAFWGDDWNVDHDSDGLISLLDPDADDDGFSDGTEITYGSDPADPDSAPQILPLEIGEADLDHNWKRVELYEPFADPVVVAGPLSINGTDPAVVRIQNFDRSGFEIRIQEWEYLDEWHVLEKVTYLVMERGSHTLSGGIQVEADKFETDRTGTFQYVAFNKSFHGKPVVLVTVSTFNGGDAVTVRVRRITPQGFEFCMQEQELNSQAHTTETISYIAWEPSSGMVGRLTFEVNTSKDVVRHDFHTVLFQQTFAKAPLILAGMQTTDGGNTANLRWRNKDRRGVDVQVDEEQSRDSEVRHTTEVVGYMIFTREDL